MDYSDLFRQWRDSRTFIKCTTSGSTGTPKTIGLPKKEMEASAWRTINFFGLKEGAVLYSCISPDYIGGKMMAIRALMLGFDDNDSNCHTRFLFEEPSNRPLARCSIARIDLLSVVPSQMHFILANKAIMPEFGAILVGGSPIPPALRRDIEESGLPAWESYGMTETSSHIALRRIKATPERFRPLPGIATDIKDGCLRIKIHGWQTLVTNDIADIGPDGAFNILGRKDNMIISGGKKINPEAVEDILSKVFDFEFAITSRPDEMWGEKVVRSADTEALTEKEIIEKCKLMLPAHCVPKNIIRRSLPHTDNGKISRKLIKFL